MKLEFIGRPGPHRNMTKFIEQVKHRRPDATPIQIERFAHTVNARNRPRQNFEIFQLFGADVMTDDLESLDVWPHVSKEWKKFLPKLPTLTGTIIPEKDGAVLNNLLVMRKYSEVNRASICVPPGLSRSYIWCRSNQWIQDVSFEDAEIIRHRPDLRSKFRPVDNADGPQIVQAYKRLPDADPIIAKTRGDIHDIAKELGLMK